MQQAKGRAFYVRAPRRRCSSPRIHARHVSRRVRPGTPLRSARTSHHACQPVHLCRRAVAPAFSSASPRSATRSHSPQSAAPPVLRRRKSPGVRRCCGSRAQSSRSASSRCGSTSGSRAAPRRRRCGWCSSTQPAHPRRQAPVSARAGPGSLSMRMEQDGKHGRWAALRCRRRRARKGVAGQRAPLRLRRSGRRPDSPAVLAIAACRITRSASFARCAQTDAASQ